MDKKIVGAGILAIVLVAIIAIYIAVVLINDEPGRYEPLVDGPLYTKSPFHLYDVNMDFHINMEDYNDCIRWMGCEYPGQYDVNRDGKCNQEDVSLILNCIQTGVNEYLKQRSWLYVGGSGPANYSTIQSAIYEANPGNTIFVYSGIYHENLGFNTSSIYMIGEDKNTTIIDGDGSGNVLLITADYMKISGFTLQASGTTGYCAGIDIHSANNVISNNIITNNRQGIGLRQNTHHNLILNNTIITNSVDSIWLYHSNNNTISGNTITSANIRGILLQASNFNTITKNIIKSFSQQGIYLEYSDTRNTISENTIKNNDYGILIKDAEENNEDYESTPSNFNTIVHNNFMNNTQNAVDYSSNIWYNDYPSGGNYWDDYNGNDIYYGLNQDSLGSDAFGDSPYNISGGSNNDFYPLMRRIQLAQSEKDWWSMFHHDPSHSGNTTSAGPITNNTKWISRDYSLIYSAPAVTNGKVYVCSGDHKLYCLNADTGLRIWSHITGTEVYGSHPAVVDDKVYIGSDDYRLYCLNASTGRTIWNYTTGYWVRGAPTIANGKVYFVSWDKRVYCLNADTGLKIWDCYIGFGSDTSPAITAGKIYVASESALYCLNAETGEKIWDYVLGYKGSQNSNPAVVYGKVYIGWTDNKTYCLNADTGIKIWEYTTGDYVYSSPAVANGKVYIGSDDYKVYCLNADTGVKIWEYTTGGRIGKSSPAIAGGKVYVGSWDEKLYCLNADTGAKIWDYMVGGYRVLSSPVIADGKVYTCFADGRVYCFGID